MRLHQVCQATTKRLALPPVTLAPECSLLLLLQLREANVTTRLYSPASTAAVDLQLSYYHRV